VHTSPHRTSAALPLIGLNADIKKDYDAALEEIKKLAPGYENSLWVKQLTTEDTLLKAKARKRQVDSKFPILGSTYKAQKSRDLEAKKKFIKEGTKDERADLPRLIFCFTRYRQ